MTNSASAAGLGAILLAAEDGRWRDPCAKYKGISATNSRQSVVVGADPRLITSIDLQCQSMTAAWGTTVQQGQRESEHGGVAEIARAPGLVFHVAPSSQGLGDELKQDLLLLEGTGRSLFARIPHGSGTQSVYVLVVYCQQRRAPGADVTNPSIVCGNTHHHGLGRSTSDHRW